MEGARVPVKRPVFGVAIVIFDELISTEYPQVIEVHVDVKLTKDLCQKPKTNF